MFSCYYHPVLSLLILTLIIWMRWSLSLSTIKVTLSFSISYSFEANHLVQQTLKWGGRRIKLCLLKVKYLHKLFGILLHRKFVSPPPCIYLCNHLHQCEIMVIYYTCCVRIQCYIILFSEILSTFACNCLATIKALQDTGFSSPYGSIQLCPDLCGSDD